MPTVSNATYYSTDGNDAAYYEALVSLKEAIEEKMIRSHEDGHQVDSRMAHLNWVLWTTLSGGGGGGGTSTLTAGPDTEWLDSLAYDGTDVWQKRSTTSTLGVVTFDWVNQSTDAVSATLPAGATLVSILQSADWQVSTAHGIFVEDQLLREFKTQVGESIWFDLSNEIAIADAAEPDYDNLRPVGPTVEDNPAGTIANSRLNIELPKPGDGAVAVAAGASNLYRPAESGAESFLFSNTSTDDNGIPEAATYGVIQFQAPPSVLADDNSRYTRDLIAFSLDGQDVTLSTDTGPDGFTLGHLGYLVLDRAQLLLIKATSNAGTEDRASVVAFFYEGDLTPFQMTHGPLMGKGASTAEATTTTFEVYELSGSLDGITAAAYGGVGVNGSPGDQLTIAPPWRHIEWEFTRAATPDPGDGSVSILKVNGLGYLPGAGDAYGPEGGSFGTPQFENTTQSIGFVAYGGCFVQIKVMR